MRGIFITGTDTGVGKTRVAAGLVAAWAETGAAVCGLKPVAAGAEETPEGLRNDDAEALRAASSVDLPYEAVNPVCLAPAMAPHLAAAEAGVDLSTATLAPRLEAAVPDGAIAVVEGAGGWLVPTAPGETLADLAVALGLPVGLVVGLRLGCLNHALLTAESIAARGLPLAGWIANHIEPDMAAAAANRDTLVDLLPAPLLAELPHVPNAAPPEVVESLRGAVSRLHGGPPG
ncbi:MAG: dethiobiotin synthase [Thiohalospira sp.]